MPTDSGTPQANPEPKLPSQVFLERVLPGIRRLLGEKLYYIIGCLVVLYGLLFWLLPPLWNATADFRYELINRIPQANPKHFTVAISELVSDTANVMQKQIRYGLNAIESMDGVDLILIPRKVQDDSRIQSEHFENCKKKAQELLTQCNADMLIYGDRLSASTAQLTLCASTALEVKTGKFTLSSELDLPPMMVSDLNEVLQASIYARLSEFADEDAFVADKLIPVVDKFRQLLESSKFVRVEAAPALHFAYANCLVTIGDQTGNFSPLREGIAAYKSLIDSVGAELPIYLWSDLQQSYGVALLLLGQRETNNSTIDSAIATLRRSLQTYSRDRQPVDWREPYRLGWALQVAGEREIHNDKLFESINVFSGAEQVFGGLGMNDALATIENSKGNALMSICERQVEKEGVLRAIETYKRALTRLRRSEVPLFWAQVRSNLGNGYLRLAERTGDSAHLRTAITCYEDALQEWHRSTVPLKWAMAKCNLGYAYWRLSERKSDSTYLRRAHTYLEESLTEARLERDSSLWAKAEMMLATVTDCFGNYDTTTQYQERAIGIYRAALDVISRQSMSYYWATAKKGLGCALQQQGEHNRDTVLLFESIDAFHEALSEMSLERAPLYWATVQNDLGTSYKSLAWITNRRDYSFESLAACLRAWGVLVAGDNYMSQTACYNIESISDYFNLSLDEAATYFNPEDAKVLAKYREWRSQSNVNCDSV